MKLKWIMLSALLGAGLVHAAPAQDAIDSKKLYGALLYHMSTTYACQDILEEPSNYQNAKTLTTNFFKVALTQESTPPEQAVELIEKKFKDENIQGKTQDYLSQQELSKEEEAGYCQALVYDSYSKVAEILPNQS